MQSFVLRPVLPPITIRSIRSQGEQSIAKHWKGSHNVFERTLGLPQNDFTGHRASTSNACNNVCLNNFSILQASLTEWYQANFSLMQKRKIDQDALSLNSLPLDLKANFLDFYCKKVFQISVIEPTLTRVNQFSPGLAVNLYKQYLSSPFFARCDDTAELETEVSDASVRQGGDRVTGKVTRKLVEPRTGASVVVDSQRRSVSLEPKENQDGEE